MDLLAYLKSCNPTIDLMVPIRMTKNRIAVLNALDKPRCPMDIAGIIGCHHSVVYRALRKLKMAGKVRRSSDSQSVTRSQYRVKLKLWERIDG